MRKLRLIFLRYLAILTVEDLPSRQRCCRVRCFTLVVSHSVGRSGGREMNDEFEAVPQPGEAPAEWRAYGWYPVLGGVAACALALLIGLIHAGPDTILPRVVLT